MPIKRYEQTRKEHGSRRRIGKIRKGEKIPVTDKNGNQVYYKKGPRKGEPKMRPVDRWWFRFVGEGVNADKMEQRFIETYGDQPKSLEVALPYPTTDMVFDRWMEEWSAQGLQHRCDGHKCVLLRDGIEMHSYFDVPYEKRPDCPYLGAGKVECSEVGRLKVILPKLGRMAEAWVMTTSKWDIRNIIDQLDGLVEDARHYFGIGDLRKMPVVLYRDKQQVSSPRVDKDTGERYRVQEDKWLLSLEAHPKWVQEQAVAHLESRKEQRLPTPRERALVAVNAGDELYGELDADTRQLLLSDGNGNARTAAGESTQPLTGEIVTDDELDDMAPSPVASADEFYDEPEPDDTGAAEPNVWARFHALADEHDINPGTTGTIISKANSDGDKAMILLQEHIDAAKEAAAMEAEANNE